MESYLVILNMMQNSTDVYLQMTSRALMGIRSPFDTFDRKTVEDRRDGE